MDKGKLKKAFAAAAAGVGGAVGVVLVGHMIVPIAALGALGAGGYYGYKYMTGDDGAAKPKGVTKPKKGPGPKQ